ncbi:MAG: DEAD/DEAH box helicase family protein [Magnetococcales bacterium]|nr:DEAD/DEAH box helicase family protein [Magnetococcales bacterium]
MGQRQTQPDLGADTAIEFRSKILTRKRSSEEFAVYRAGLEWALTDPIVIESSDDFKSAQRWRDHLTPFHHQVSNLITFCRRLPVTLLADDVGLGKTISAGLIISELLSRSRLSKVLIVAPKLLGPQWKEELETKFDFPAEVATGKALITADHDEAGAVITTYNSARLYLDDIPDDRFQMLILDEAHKLRNLYGVQATPQVAKRFRKALEDRRFRFVLMLTATPIQNRLWDIYSLVDLLAVARGHENPFGSEGMYFQRFIADRKNQARQLKTEAQDEFRSIVYGYMSRVRRGDAKLYFPERVVQMHNVDPTPSELKLIETIAKPIQKLNRLAQISILQALTSSPEALMAQLVNMARNRTVSQELAATVKDIVSKMPHSAKLHGLGRLIEQLKKEKPDSWRLVVFTGRRETQTTIQVFLDAHGLKVGIINGDSGARNQETVARFRQNPPGYRVIVSTEAGSEGVNLQVANVLVNYDLPWNPMIVEQRIGRIQRLASDYANVSIFNVMLRGTFEEYIVGRLMEKLQMASHAIGDIEALLQGSDIGDSDEDVTTSFEDRILSLVLAALAGKDVEKETRIQEQNIAEAKEELEREQANIDAMLGNMDGASYVGPRTPSLPDVTRSMDAKDFAIAALRMLGVTLSPKPDSLYLAEEDGRREHVRFEDTPNTFIKSILYAPGSAAFQRLIDRVTATGIHEVGDLDDEPARTAETIAREWVASFGGRQTAIEITDVKRYFGGNAILRVRATVAHDSYERLVEVPCSAHDHTKVLGRPGLAPLPKTVEDPAIMGLDPDRLKVAAGQDDAIAEFSRFYLERREQEVRGAGQDERKRKKLFDEFTPRLAMTLVGLTGHSYREIIMRARYAFDTDDIYESIVGVIPHNKKVSHAQDMGVCTLSARTVPASCLTRCELSGAYALRHLLVKSGVSGRPALPIFAVVCALSGKLVLKDEVETSAATGKLIASSLLKTSTVSGKRAEPDQFVRCMFTGAMLLHVESAVSEISGQPYRIDEHVRSAVSGRSGHKAEFVICHETHQPIALAESEQCEVTGKRVRFGVLRHCEVSGKHVLPGELEGCAATGKHVLKQLLVTSSVSQVRILESVATRSSTGKYCAPVELRTCFWSDLKTHPNDMRDCALTRLPIHFQFAAEGTPRLKPLAELLDGIRRTADETPLWESAATQVAAVLNRGKCRVEAAVLSPTGKHLALIAEVKTFMGLRKHQVGAVYEFATKTVVGRIAEGKLSWSNWN